MSLLLVNMDCTLREPLNKQQYFQHPIKTNTRLRGHLLPSDLTKDGWIVVGLTNKGGVAVGHKSIQHRTQEQQYTLQVFPELREIYFCPDFEGRNASASPFTSCITS